MEKLKVEDLSLIVDEQIEKLLFDNEHMGFEKNKKSPTQNYLKGNLNSSFPPYKAKQDQAPFDAIERFQNADKTIETKEEDFVKQFDTARDSAHLRFEEQKEVVKNLQSSRNKIRQEYHSLENKLKRIITRIEAVENLSEKHLKAIKE